MNKEFENNLSLIKGVSFVEIYEMLSVTFLPLQKIFKRNNKPLQRNNEPLRKMLKKPLLRRPEHFWKQSKTFSRKYKPLQRGNAEPVKKIYRNDKIDLTNHGHQIFNYSSDNMVSYSDSVLLPISNHQYCICKKLLLSGDIELNPGPLHTGNQ